MNASLIILAGGKSTRMGRDKAFLEMDRENIISRIIGRLNGVFKQLVVVSNNSRVYSNTIVESVRDIVPGFGPLSGIHAGLTAARYEYSMVLACDMPFVERKLVCHLVSEAPGWDAVVPEIGGLLEPLFAVYSKGCLPAVERCLDEKTPKVTAFYSRVRVKYVTKGMISRLANPEKVFFNVNTPGDFDRALFLAEEEDSKNI